MIFYHRDTIELGNFEIDIEIEYEVSRYVPATRLDPPEGGMVEEIRGVYIHSIDGCDYMIEREDLGDWLIDLESLAMDFVEVHYDDYVLLEAANDYEVC